MWAHEHMSKCFETWKPVCMPFVPDLFIQPWHASILTLWLHNNFHSFLVTEVFTGPSLLKMRFCTKHKRLHIHGIQKKEEEVEYCRRRVNLPLVLRKWKFGVSKFTCWNMRVETGKVQFVFLWTILHNSKLWTKQELIKWPVTIYKWFSVVQSMNIHWLARVKCAQNI